MISKSCKNFVGWQSVAGMLTIPALALAAGAAISFLAVLFTFNLNNGPFNLNYYNSVGIIMSSHGHLFWFPFSAVAGSLLVFLLARATPPNKTFLWMGQNTLILMCLNGVFYHFINPVLAKWVFANYSGQGLVIFASGIIVTVASLALSAPCIYIFNKYVPQLVGRPRVSGPWLKPLVKPAA